MKRMLEKVVWAMLLVSHVALADQVLLKNGDVISGEIIKKETDKLVFKTNYAGELQIQWSEVNSLSSDEIHQVVLGDGTNLTGKLAAAADGEMTLLLDQEALPVELRETKYINPRVDLTGEGTHWSGNVNLGGSIAEGNNSVRSVRFDGETIARTLHSRYTLGGIINRAHDRDSATQSNSRFYGKYDYFFARHWYGYTNQTLENDRFRDLELRSVSGIGSGYQVFETPNLNLALEGGADYIRESFYAATTRSYPAVRWAIKYDQLFFSGTTRFFHEHEVLQGLEQNKQTLVYSKTGLRFPLLFNFNATSQLNLNWDSHPADGRKKEDAALIFTLGYGWE